MTMTNEEIIRDYCQARNKSKQIKILAELNCTKQSEIRAVLATAPEVTGIAASKARQRGAAPPTQAVPDVYQQIETVLASLPEGMGRKARWAAGKMLAELFAEYLVQRLELREEEQNATD